MKTRTRPSRRPQTACGKRRYRDLAEAKGAMRWIQEHAPRGFDAPMPVRAYLCLDCCGAHLTSQA